jgi:hypothetical protein
MNTGAPQPGAAAKPAARGAFAAAAERRGRYKIGSVQVCSVRLTWLMN